jgi:uncharacterized protein
MSKVNLKLICSASPMKRKILDEIQQLNPWLVDPAAPLLELSSYLPRTQEAYLLEQEWDAYWTILVGPRRAGKTTLGHFLSHRLLAQQRFETLLYISCDLTSVRTGFDSPLFLQELLQHLKLSNPIVFIDEVQRLENPGLLLKAIADLKLPIKMIASGSSQLEIKSKVQEYLTGREVESLVLPLSLAEIKPQVVLEDQLLFGSYPQVIQSKFKQDILQRLYQRYIARDIVEILQLGKPDVLEKLITLIAHSSGQLINYQQLATDCRVSIPTVQNYLSILEKTYVLAKVTPFVANKRTEITSNPIYYFIDNGFRNQALRNFSGVDGRTDVGMLVESLVFQEILKYKTQHFLDFDIHYWRTKTGAEVDFVVYQNNQHFIPIEVKYRNLNKAKITRGYRSFLQAYKPKIGIVITKDIVATETFEGSEVHFIPLTQLNSFFEILRQEIP